MSMISNSKKRGIFLAFLMGLILIFFSSYSGGGGGKSDGEVARLFLFSKLIDTERRTI